MKRIFNWQFFLGIGLVLASALFYFIHYLIFKDAHHIFSFLISDIAFVFLEVLLVTLVLHQLLHYHEKKKMLNKLNMVIGVFFSEVGTELIRIFLTFDFEDKKNTEQLIVRNDWNEKKFLKIRKKVKTQQAQIDIKKGDLKNAKNFLKGKRQFLLALLENPNLLEHETFTNLLWAVFHLSEELICRHDLAMLTDTDAKHLAGDIERAYQLLVDEWLSFMQHLKQDYPYLFSLALRTSPFDANASAEVK